MTTRNDDDLLRILGLLVGSAALCAGVYGRFAGIGRWPLGVDEFYISRSIDHVLRTGLPKFPCGGYYTRGLLYQYLVAGLRLLGATPEYAGRVIPGLASLAVLPAAYLVAKRLQGALAGVLTVVILCVSVWEIEMARFGRMYAPFQAVFVWYLVYFLRYTVDRDDRAMKWLAGLSVLGVLTWEGGALLGAASLLAVVWRHERGRLRIADWRRLGGFLVLLGLLYLATRDLRGFAAPPATAGSAAPAPSGPLHALLLWVSVLRLHTVWWLGLLPPIATGIAALPALRALSARPLACAGLITALLAAALHLFVVCVGVLALLLLTRLIVRRDLEGTLWPWYCLSLAAFLIFWAAFDYWVGVPEHAVAGVPRLVRDLFGFPDVYGVVVRPWARTLPVLTAAVGLAVLYWCGRTELADDAPQSAAVLLTVLCLMALAVGSSSPERVETRYTFFLYPPLIALAVSAVLSATRASTRHGLKLAAAAALPLACFAATEDFQPRHLVNVDTAVVTFRVGMSPARAAHYYPRNDMRIVAGWLHAHGAEGDIVVSGIANLDQYYHGFDYFYLDDDDPRYDAYVCPRGGTERWTNHPVLYTVHSLEPLVASGRRVLVLVWPDTEAHLKTAAAAEGWSVTRLWQTDYGDTRVLRIAAKSGPRHVLEKE
ncbi:MAG: glycosyltransferase family 39 protein [Gammaproteobacteria bacterium]